MRGIAFSVLALSVCGCGRDIPILATWTIEVPSRLEEERELMSNSLEEARRPSPRPELAEKHVVVRNTDDWRYVWGERERPLPAVDFEHRMVVIAREWAQWPTHVAAVTQKGDHIEVDLRREVLPPGWVGIGDVSYAIVSCAMVPRTDRPVVFVTTEYYRGPEWEYPAAE